MPDEENKCYTATRRKLIFAHAYTADDKRRDYFSRASCMRVRVREKEEGRNAIASI